jgi:hypothetical protein
MRQHKFREHTQVGWYSAHDDVNATDARVKPENVYRRVDTDRDPLACFWAFSVRKSVRKRNGQPDLRRGCWVLEPDKDDPFVWRKSSHEGTARRAVEAVVS